MAKNSVRQWSTTAASNLDIQSISLAENVTRPSDVNDFERAHMAQVAQLLAEMSYPTFGGTADALTLTPTTALAAYANNVVYTGTIGASPNATTTPTLNISTLGAVVIRKMSAGTDVAVAAGDLPALTPFAFIYKTAANAGGGAWVILGAASVAAASTTQAGIVELATNAETIAPPVGSILVPTIGNLFFPPGFIYGLTASTNASDATNDIDIAVGASRSDDDTDNIRQTSALVKRADGGTWVVGTNQPALDTGAIANSRYAIWEIKRPDTGVVDTLFSLSFTAPTMPTNYTLKTLIGEFTRAAGVNAAPLSYASAKAANGRYGITLAVPVASTSGTALDFTGIPAWVDELNVLFVGFSTTGTSNYMVQLGSGSIQTTGYLGAAANTASGTTFTTGFGIIAGAATVVMHGFYSIKRVSGNTWVGSHAMGRSDAASISNGGGSVTLSGALDRIRVTTVGGTDTLRLGTLNVSTQ